MPKRIHLPMIVAVAAALVLGGAAIGWAATGAHHRRAPRLSLVSRSPLTVRGQGFAPRRHVRVALEAGAVHVRTVRTGSRGGFSVTFRTVVDRCTAWTVVARQGHARVVLPGPKPECAPAGTP